MAERTVYQPIPAEIADKLLPEYAAFHKQFLEHTVPVHELPWSPDIRKSPAVMGGSEPLKVGKVQDYPLTHCSVRVFTPEGDAPAGGWPVFIFLHGGTHTPHTSPNPCNPHLCRRMDARHN